MNVIRNILKKMEGLDRIHLLVTAYPNGTKIVWEQEPDTILYFEEILENDKYTIVNLARAQKLASLLKQCNWFADIDSSPGVFLEKRRDGKNYDLCLPKTEKTKLYHLYLTKES